MKFIRLTALFTLAAILLISTTTLAQRERKRGDRRGKIRERMQKPDNAPKVGENAPMFKLKSLDGKSETDLASFRGKRPVVLFFGSYT